jgi:hypothetical protein
VRTLFSLRKATERLLSSTVLSGSCGHKYWGRPEAANSRLWTHAPLSGRECIPRPQCEEGPNSYRNRVALALATMKAQILSAASVPLFQIVLVLEEFVPSILRTVPRDQSPAWEHRDKIESFAANARTLCNAASSCGAVSFVAMAGMIRSNPLPRAATFPQMPLC